MTFLMIQPLIPEIFLAIMAMLLLLWVAYGEAYRSVESFYKVGALTLLLAFGLLFRFQMTSGAADSLLGGLVVIDNFALYIKSLVLLGGATILIMSLQTASEDESTAKGEFAVLLMLAVLGMMIMVSANNLMSLYMGLELQSLSLYVLTALHRSQSKPSEAALKYFMLGALSSGLLLFGASLIYGFIGTLSFEGIAAQLLAQEGIEPAALLGVIFVLVGVLFKMSAAPFHMWTPDVYEGAPKHVTAFFATAPKAAAIGLLVRLLADPFYILLPSLQQILIVVSVLSMTIGAFAALKQTNIKRLLAYSSIGHVGYMLIGLAAGTTAGLASVSLYMLIYIVMNLGLFCCVLLMKVGDQHVESIRDLSGVARHRPLYAAAISILMLSMAGIPPMAGFLGKFFVFDAAIQAELYALAVIGVLTSVVAAFYYLRIIKIMYFDSSEYAIQGDANGGLRTLITSSVFFSLFMFLVPNSFLSLAAWSVAGLLG